MVTKARRAIDINAVRTVILLAAIAGASNAKETLYYWKKLDTELAPLIHNYPAHIPSVLTIARIKQELDAHDLSELKCERFGDRMLLTLPAPSPDAAQNIVLSGSLINAKQNSKTDLSYIFSLDVRNYGHKYLRRPRGKGYGAGVVKNAPSKSMLAFMAELEGCSAVGLVLFFFFDDVSLFGGRYLDKRRFEPVEKEK